jgi:hypothetical protein
MKVIKRIAELAKRVAASRTAQIFFFVHLAVLVIALVQKRTIQPEHWEYEFLLYKILTFFNLPASLLVGLMTLPFIILLSPVLPSMNLNGPYPFIIFVYIAWQIQAALIGYGIEKLINRWRGLR